MVYKLNILHLLIALGAAGCAGVVLREASGRLVHPSRLFAAPLLAAVAALFLLAVVSPEWREPQLWGVALTLADSEATPFEALAAAGAAVAVGFLGGRALVLLIHSADPPRRHLRQSIAGTLPTRAR